jgi:hypothetical protein
MKRARAVDSYVSGSRGKGKSRQIETLDPEGGNVGSMRTWDHTEFTILASCPRHGNAHGQATAMTAVTAHGAILVPADIRDPLNNANLL